MSPRIQITHATLHAGILMLILTPPGAVTTHDFYIQLRDTSQTVLMRMIKSSTYPPTNHTDMSRLSNPDGG